MPLPTVSVVIPTFQRARTLERTLSALHSVDYPDERLEIIVVDDGSTDSTAAVVAQFRAARYVRQANSGVASARNHGAKLATGDLLLFVDDDIVVAPDNIGRHLEVRAEYGECVVCGHAEFPPDVRAALSGSPFGRFRLWSEDVFQGDGTVRSGRTEPLTVATANLSITRRLFWAVGGFDDRFPVGAEDQDLCWRARSAGARIVRDYDIRVVHNDQHDDLRALCRREERGAVGIVYLTRKHADFPAPSALRLNGPLSRRDPPRVVLRKIAREAMSQPLPLAVAHRMIRVVEFLRPQGGWPLQYLYRGLTGLYVFRGIRRGLQLTSRDTWAPGHEAAIR